MGVVGRVIPLWGGWSLGLRGKVMVYPNDFFSGFYSPHLLRLRYPTNYFSGFFPSPPPSGAIPHPLGGWMDERMWKFFWGFFLGKWYRIKIQRREEGNGGENKWSNNRFDIIKVSVLEKLICITRDTKVYHPWYKYVSPVIQIG